MEPPVLCADVHYNRVTPLNLSQGNRQDMLFAWGKIVYYRNPLLFERMHFPLQLR